MDPRLIEGAVLAAAGYLIGSLPAGILVARLTGGRDPRTVGSGRTGGTNALRAMGARRALAVVALDVAKGAVPIALCIAVGADAVAQSVAGVGAILGSMRSVFVGFGGGRGVAAGVGATLVIQPLAVVIAAPVFLGIIWLSRYVSLGSLLGSAACGSVIALLVGMGVQAPATIIFAVGGVVLIWLAHADNIQRLRSGQERTFTFLDRDPA